MDMKPLLKPKDLADLLGVTTFTLAHWRRPTVLSGPPYIRIGRSIRYRRDDVDAWVAARNEETPA